MTISWTLPPSWVWANFGDVADICSNLVDPAEFSDQPHIAPNHIVSWTGHLLPYTTIAEDKVISGKHRFFSGQILYSKIRPYLAKAARVDFSGLCSADMYPISAKIDSAYLHRWMLTPQFTEAASGHQGRTVLPKINQQALVTVPVPVAPQREQIRIAEKLERLIERSSAAKSVLDNVPELLNRLRQAILAAAFRGDLTADWRARNPDVEPADKLLERIRAERRRRWEATELARLTAKGKPPADDHRKERAVEKIASQSISLPDAHLPSSWQWISIGEVFDVFVGSTPSRAEPGYWGEGVPWVSSGEVAFSRIMSTREQVTRDGLINSSLRKHPPGTVLIGMIGEGKTRGQAAILDIEACHNQNSASIRVSETEIIPEYVFYFLWRQYETTRSAGSGNSQPALNKSRVESIPLPLCSVAEQAEIVKRIEAAFKFIDGLDVAHANIQELLTKLEQATLSRAFRGELVPHDPNDEPASVLLERLRAETAAAPTKPGRRARASALADEDPSEHRPATPRPRPRAAAPAPEPPKTSAAAPSPVVPPAPTPRAGQQPLPLAFPSVDFLELPADAQAERVHAVLLGEGPLVREDAVRRAADRLRDTGLAAFQRLRRDGPLAACIDAAISVGLREGRFDRPARGSVRAVAPEPAVIPPPLWRRALLAALDSPHHADEAVRAAADWCQAQFGLDFKRLRTGGHIDTALRTALAELRAAGEVVEDRSGTLSVRARNT